MRKKIKNLSNAKERNSINFGRAKERNKDRFRDRTGPGTGPFSFYYIVKRNTYIGDKIRNRVKKNESDPWNSDSKSDNI